MIQPNKIRSLTLDAVRCRHWIPSSESHRHRQTSKIHGYEIDCKWTLIKTSALRNFSLNLRDSHWFKFRLCVLIKCWFLKICFSLICWTCRTSYFFIYFFSAIFVQCGRRGKGNVEKWFYLLRNFVISGFVPAHRSRYFTRIHLMRSSLSLCLSNYIRFLVL